MFVENEHFFDEQSSEEIPIIFCPLSFLKVAKCWKEKREEL